MIRNFGIVVPGRLYRSGKYTADALRQVIHQHRIQLIVDLRDRDPLLAAATYRRLGVIFKSYPIAEYQPFPPAALSLWDGQTPTLIHCWKGAHRTGVWVALYRLSQGWPKAQAIAEMLDYGFGDPAAHAALYASVRDDL